MTLPTDIAIARRRVKDAERELRRLLTVAVVLRDGNRCVYCQIETRAGDSGPLGRTLDHVVPRVFGGKDELINLKLACRSCNARKGKQVTQAQLCPSCRQRGEGSV